jgi:hypothetical protein
MSRLTPLVRASNPMRFGLAGKRQGGTDEGELEAEILESAEGPHLLRVLAEHIQHQTDALDKLAQHQRMQRQRVYTEYFYVASGSRAEPQNGTQDQFRVTYIWAYVGGTKAATLHLRGGPGGDTLNIPIVAGSALSVVAGDEATGGIILERRDQRYITVDDGTSQLIVAFLCGEVLKDTYLG